MILARITNMIETLKSWFLSIFILLLIIGLGYWAFYSIESGSEHAVNQKIEELEDKNRELQKEVDKLTKELTLYKPAEETPEVIPEENTPAPVVTTYKNQGLISELEQLVIDKINMKVGSRGTRVGTVQNFLNLYNNTNNKVDNTYGEGTKKVISAFQKAVGLKADGNAGPATYEKMIEWLKSQG